MRTLAALVSHQLLIHADVTFYAGYGTSVAAANAALLAGDDADRWATPLGQFAARLAFNPRWRAADGLRIGCSSSSRRRS